MPSLYEWIVWGGEVLRPFQPYGVFGTLATVAGIFAKLRRSWRVVAVFAVDETTKERKLIASIPYQFATRAEVLGRISNLAGGKQLDFRRFQPDYKYHRELDVPLPSDQFKLLDAPVHR